MSREFLISICIPIYNGEDTLRQLIDSIIHNVADYKNSMIRKIVISTGVVTTLAGSTTSGSANGTGTAASFNYPADIATDGTSLFVSDMSNHMIRKID